MVIATKQRVEQQLLADAVARLERTQAFSVVFGGLPTREGIDITAIRGNRHNLLGNLHVVTERGLGGRAIAERRPRIAPDYRTSRHITHDYDREVLSEQIRTLLAVPVLVDGHVRGMIYGGIRHGGDIGTIAVQPAVRIAGELSREFAMHDRVLRLARGGVGAPSRPIALPAGASGVPAFDATLARHEPESSAAVIDLAPQGEPATMPPAQLEELRASYAELRSIASAVTDPALLERLQHLEQRLVRLTAPPVEPTERVRLSPRETDVLGFVALGRTSAEIAGELGLTESTVKSYLATGMRKLGAHTRHEAVTIARSKGLLP